MSIEPELVTLDKSDAVDNPGAPDFVGLPDIDREITVKPFRRL